MRRRLDRRNDDLRRAGGNLPQRDGALLLNVRMRRQISSNGSTSCAGSRTTDSALTGPVSSHADCTACCNASACLLSETMTMSGDCAARANSGIWRALAAALSPDTRRRPEADRRWRPHSLKRWGAFPAPRASRGQTAKSCSIDSLSRRPEVRSIAQRPTPSPQSCPPARCSPYNDALRQSGRVRERLLRCAA